MVPLCASHASPIYDPDTDDDADRHRVSCQPDYRIFHASFPGISGYGSFAVIAGFLCGYPMGAKVTADLTVSERISPDEGAFLLSFCNDLSPMFILGVLFRNYLPEHALHLPFFLILTGSPLLCSQMFRALLYPQAQDTF